MRRADIYCRGVHAGVLAQGPDGYVFEYVPAYVVNPALPPISLSFPKQKAAFRSAALFPFFFGLLAEGGDKLLQCRLLKIDENDHFTRLLKTCATETIGGITVREVQ
jgi:serine/threonine-protein kinase HipA